MGGTPAEAWTSREALDTDTELKARADKEIAEMLSQPEDSRRFPNERGEWEQKNRVVPPDNKGFADGWAKPGLDVSDWKKVTLPGNWEQLGFKSGGVFWIRKDFEAPAEYAGKPFRLDLGWLDEEYDTEYINGVEVGHCEDKAPGFYRGSRSCQAPADLVRPGINTLAIRFVSASPKNGFWQPVASLGLPVADKHSIDKQWLLKEEASFPPVTAQALAERPKPNSRRAVEVSSTLFNGMVAPLIPYTIKGAIWYQGENNAGQAAKYRTLLPLMISDWREGWNLGEFPFYIMQLANFNAPTDDPG